MSALQSQRKGLRNLPRNVWAASLTSFLTDISSEMILHLIPLFLQNVLGVTTDIVGLIEGIAESIASLLKVFSGWISDKLRARKWLAVAGYAISAFSKPFFYFANSWLAIALTRWSDRVGKGIRTAPRDALVASSVDEEHRGLAFGLHRAADTGGAALGILATLLIVWSLQRNNLTLTRSTFQTVVLISLIPAFLGVLALAIGARDVPVSEQARRIPITFRGLGKRFALFVLIVGIFDLGNSSDAFLTLRAQERGLSVVEILGILFIFNLVYSLTSTPAGSLSDRIGRRRLILGGWLFYALIYLGFGLAKAEWHIGVLYALYGLYYGLAYGTTRAMIADLVPAALQGTAYGTYNTIVGLLDFPASVIAGLLWKHIAPSAPFFFGAAMAFIAFLLMLVFFPSDAPQS